MRLVLEVREGGVPIGGVRISNLCFADDTVLITQNEEELTAILNKLERISAEHGLKINMAKTKIMIVDKINNNRNEIQNIAGQCNGQLRLLG